MGLRGIIDKIKQKAHLLDVYTKQFCIEYIRKIYLYGKKTKPSKDVLLYCTHTTMEQHIIDYYETVKGIQGIRFFLLYEQETFSDEMIKQGIERITKGRNIITVEKYSKVWFHNWGLIACADIDIPKYMTKRTVPIIYLNHGLHIVSLDGGEHLYAYSKYFGVKKNGKPKFTVMLEPNKAHKGYVIKENPYLTNTIKAVGIKDAEKIIAEKANYKKYRKQLGIKEGQIVVAMLATWREESLFHKVGKHIIEQANKMDKNKYKFILSIHPKEYIKYDEHIENMGPFVDSQKKNGMIVRDPKDSFIPYLIASDVVIADYSSMYELALLADKKMIFSEFDKSIVWKKSTIAQIMEKIPVYNNKSDLEEYIQNAINSKEYENVFNKYKNNIMPPKCGYKKAVIGITKKMMKI